MLLCRLFQTVVHSLVVELLVGDAKRVVGDVAQHILLQLSETFELLHGLALVANVLHEGGDVFSVAKNAFLSHASYGRHHLVLAQAENVGEVVNTRLSLGILCARYVFLRYERLDYSHRILHFFFVEERRRGDALTGLVHVAHGDARGIDMRHVVAALNVAALFQGGKGCPHACLYVRDRIVPSCLSGYLKGRALQARLVVRGFLHGLPHLLYLADAQLCLVEQNEMFVKVVVGVEHKAAGRQRRVASGASGFLHIVLERVGNVVVDHQPHIALVYAHAEC